MQSALLGWHQVPLADLLSRATGGIPVVIENDTRALATYEKTFGHLRKYESAVAISHGSGIGSAAVIYGRIWRGAHGGAGEIAHCTIVPAGKPCRCGKRGCLDTVASLTAIFEQARMEGIEATSLAELEALARKGTPGRSISCTRPATRSGWPSPIRFRPTIRRRSCWRISPIAFRGCSIP
ncbi:Making large colonies protein [Raoultella terrigena]|uniref:Making large colonies protein n=1 Tax=Raoultella terrigena TaxID=577 RepID=A0A3P8M1A0_RAOTE|nr:Making large colonies protein [Raoultella terrigena]